MTYLVIDQGLDVKAGKRGLRNSRKVRSGRPGVWQICQVLTIRGLARCAAVMGKVIDMEAGQLPLAPPVLMGFLAGPLDLVWGLAMNLEPPWFWFLDLAPALFFLSLI